MSSTNKPLKGRAASVGTHRAGSRHKAMRKSQATRLSILTNAAQCFAERGYVHTKMVDIAERSELHITALYYYFRNKEELAGGLLLYTMERNSTAWHEAIDNMPGQPWRHRIEAAVHGYLAAILRPDNFMRAYRAIVAQVDPSVRAAALAINRKDGESWKHLFEQAQVAGEIAADRDIDMLRMAALGAMNWSPEWFVPDIGSSDRLAESVCAMIFCC